MMKKKMIMYLFIGLGLMGLFLLEPDAIYSAGSGVTELDNAANKTNTLKEYARIGIGNAHWLSGKS